MKKFIYMAVAAIAALSSCSNENEIESNNNGVGESTFFATMEKNTATRVALSGNTPSWESGDVISIDGHEYTAAEDVATTGKFTGEGATETTHHAYFPASMYSKDGEVVTISLPASYEYTAGKFNMPMYAESENTTLQFKNLCGVLAITVPSTQMSSVTSIEVSSDQQMNGTISGITAEGVLSFASATLTDADKKVTLTASPAVSISSSVIFYVPVPAGTHNPLVISVSDGTTTKTMTTKKSGGVEVDRNKIYPITFAATTGSAAIKGGGTVNWVQLWAGGPKFAEKNIGASSVAEQGTEMTFAQATLEGDAYAWGSLWCTPSKDAMEHLMTAAKGQTDDKVKCEYTQEGSTYGFKFTGKTTGYESNSVFFPVQYGGSGYGNAYYWSGSPNSSWAWFMSLGYDGGDWSSDWISYYPDISYPVRPVLKN